MLLKMIKVFLNQDGSIAKREPAKFKEVFVNLDITDTVVICDDTKEICNIKYSSQWKKELAELEAKDELEADEVWRYIFLWWESKRHIK